VGEQFFGSEVRGAGDLNGDGFADVIGMGVNTSTANPDCFSRAYFGGSGEAFDSTSDLVFKKKAFQAGKCLFQIRQAGDLNLDGFSDVVTSLPNGNSTYIYSFRGNDHADSTPVDEVSVPWTVSSLSVGDVNSDGRPDITAMGSPTGQLRGVIFLQDASGTFASPMFLTDTDATDFGKSAFLGDVNGDGFGDMGVPYVPTPGQRSVRVYFGGAPPEPTADGVLADAQAGSDFGASMF
jgi:hypothetical protein